MRDLAVSMPRTLTRSGVAAAAIAVSALSIWTAVDLTSTYSIHLCGWPASISCESGARFFWLIPIAVAGVGFAGASLVIAWATGLRRRGWVGVAHSGWAITTVLFVLFTRPRSFGRDELLIGSVWFGLGIELVRAYGLVLFPDWRRAVHVVVAVIWIVFLAVLLWVPAALEAAAATDRVSPRDVL